jgi:hypothetical protein
MARTSDCVRAEIDIDAPIDRCWQILVDLDHYEAWNPFTPRVESTLRVGDPIHLHVRMSGERLMHRVETVTRNQPHTLGWGTKMGGGFLLSAERIQVLTAIDEDRTRYMTQDSFTGWLRPLVLGLYGKAMERGFADCAMGLKKAAESR